MKIKLSFFFLIFLSFFNNTFSSIEDKIIAKIDNKIVTNYDIVNEVNTILALTNKPANENEFRKLQKLAFASLQKRLIKETEIKRYKISNYNKADVNSYIQGLENNLGLIQQNISLKDHFKRYGANYEIYLDGVIINFKWNTLIYSLYRKQLDVDEELIKSELNKQIQKENKIEEFNLSEIVLENWDQIKLNEVKKSIKNNGFVKTATLYSDSISSTKGGSIGWVVSKSISSKYLNEILKLKKTQISEPIRVNNNIVIIKLNDKRILNQSNLNLVEIEKKIIRQKKEEKLNIFSDSHYLNLEKKTYIEINE
tara:strand:+ start:2914 stop:3846 length:933 start_codon:yes stop_codon:yes gene_type:complete